MRLPTCPTKHLHSVSTRAEASGSAAPQDHEVGLLQCCQGLYKEDRGPFPVVSISEEAVHWQFAAGYPESALVETQPSY